MSSEVDETTEQPEALEQSGASALSKADLKAHLAVSPETRLVEGCRVQALSGARYHEYQALLAQGLRGLPPEKAQQKAAESDMAGLLAVGVVEPRLEFAEWQKLVRDGDFGKLQRIVDTIREVSDLVDPAIAFAKNAFEQMFDAGGN